MTSVNVPVKPGGTVWTVERMNGRPCLVGHDVTHITVDAKGETSVTYDYFGAVKTAVPSLLGVSVFTYEADAMEALRAAVKKEREGKL